MHLAAVSFHHLFHILHHPQGLDSVWAVIASTDWGFLAWQLVREEDNPYSNNWAFKTHGLPIQLQFVYNLTDWVVFPSEVHVPNADAWCDHIYFSLSADHQSLAKALVMNGDIMKLSMEQIRKLMRALDLQPTGTTKLTLVAQIITEVVDDIAERNQALDKANAMSVKTTKQDLESRVNPELESVMESMDSLNLQDFIFVWWFVLGFGRSLLSNVWAMLGAGVVCLVVCVFVCIVGCFLW